VRVRVVSLLLCECEYEPDECERVSSMKVSEEPESVLRGREHEEESVVGVYTTREREYERVMSLCCIFCEKSVVRVRPCELLVSAHLEAETTNTRTTRARSHYSHVVGTTLLTSLPTLSSRSLRSHAHAHSLAHAPQAQTLLSRPLSHRA
jgi:hypothetical protein